VQPSFLDSSVTMFSRLGAERRRAGGFACRQSAALSPPMSSWLPDSCGLRAACAQSFN
jgi:hypothetical protein